MSVSRLAMRSARTQLRAVPRARIPVARFNSTIAGNSTGRDSVIQNGHFMSGLAGGGAVLVGGYLMYYFSDLKTAVDASNRVTSTLKNAKDQVRQSIPPPNEALSYLRSVARSYAVFIPGGAASIDSVFDSIDELHAAHREEVDAIISGAYKDVKKIVDERKSVNVDSVLAVLGVLQKRAAELGNVAGNLTSDAVAPILERHPKLRNSIGGSWDEFKDFAKRNGPAVKKLYDDTANKIIDTVQSKGVTPTSITTIVQIVRDKSEEAKKVAENTAKDAWERARKQAGPTLDEIPEIKKTLDENASVLMSIGGGGIAAMSGANVREIWDRIRQVANIKGGINEDRVNELKDFILEKVEEAKLSGKKKIANKVTGGGFENMVKMIPGGEEILNSTPDLKELFQLTQSKSDEAQKLTHETYDDILKVFKEKAEKAKHLGQGAH